MNVDEILRTNRAKLETIFVEMSRLVIEKRFGELEKYTTQPLEEGTTSAICEWLDGSPAKLSPWEPSFWDDLAAFQIGDYDEISLRVFLGESAQVNEQSELMLDCVYHVEDDFVEFVTLFPT